MFTDLFAARAFGGFAAGLALALTLAGSAAATEDAAKPPIAAAATSVPAAQLSIKDFLADATYSHVRLSPSGDKLAMVKSDGEIDELRIIDLKTSKFRVLFRTRKAEPREHKQKIRQEISYVHWKTETRLVVSISSPTEAPNLGIHFLLQVPVHVILSIDGQVSAVPINEKNVGKKSATLEISEILDVLRHDPDHLLVAFRQDLGRFQVERVDVRDGSRVVVERGDPSVIGYGVDRKGFIITRDVEHSDGSITVQGRAPGENRWTKIFDINKKSLKFLSEWELLSAGPSGVLYVKSKPNGPDQGDTKVVRTYDLKTATLGPIVWSHPKFDVDNIITGEETGELLAGCYWADVYQCDFKDPVLAANLKALSKFFEGKRSISIVSQSDDDKHWVLRVSGPEEPSVYYLFDVKAHNIEPVANAMPRMNADSLGSMRRFEFKSRDGTALFAYVTEPPHAGAGRLPMVVLPHGGPEVSDHYAYDTFAQFLSTRGFVVLQPIFRGSGGYGRKFAEAGYGEWGGRMHDDVTDAARAIIASGRVDPGRVCIVGASYGGYEALWSAHAEPALYRCAVSIDGLSDLRTEMNWERRYGADSSVYKYWLRSIGDPKVDENKLLARSPVQYAKTWTVPLLLIHGGSDDNVDVAQSRIMKRALEAEHKAVRYVEIRHMGHGPETDAEWTQVLTELEAFLAPHLNASAPAAPAKPAIAASTP